MKTWHFVVVATAILAMIGCRTDPNILMLEQENRLLEDEIWRLRWALEDCGESIASGKFNPGAATSAGGSSSPRTFRGGAPAAPAGPLQIDLGEQMQEGERPKIFGRKSSGVSPEPQPDTNRMRPMPVPPRQEPPDKAPRFEPGGTRQLPPRADSAKVEFITLRDRLCGGYDGDGRPGDEGIRFMLEPRDAQGHILAAPGEVSVVALDPAAEGEAARVARWDFPAHEIARRFRKGGFLLEALWPAPPKHNDLHLFVRYTTRDGRRIEIDRPIRVALSGSPSTHRPPTEPRPTPARRPPPPPNPEPELQVEGPAGPGAPGTPQVRFPHRSPTAAARPTPATRRPAWSPYRDR